MRHSYLEEVSAAGDLQGCRDEIGAACRLYVIRDLFLRAGRPFGSTPISPAQRVDRQVVPREIR